ncbi:MAG: choice-of-anchor D domain-containing protein [Terriglobales bacterium]
MKGKFASVAISVFSTFFLALVPAVLAAAQERPAQPEVFRNPEVSYPVYFDVSPPLSEMAKEAAPQLGFHLAPPVQYPKLELLQEAARRGQARAADGALQKSFGPLVGATLGLNLLGVGNGFPGYSVPDAPTDVNLAVGDTQVVQWVNVSYAVFDKTTGATLAGPIAGNALWSGFGGPCQTNNSGDPITLWDKIAHRWLMAQNVFSGPPYYTCIAISTTPDATGTWFRYQYAAGGSSNQSVFPDYPKWGVWPDAYYQHNNGFGGANSFQSEPCAFERAKLLTGDSSAKQICFAAPTTFDDSMLPADLDSASQLPPSGEPEVFVGSIDNGSTTSVYQYLFHVDFTTPTNSTFTGFGGTMPITVASFGLACGGFSACIPQKGIPDKLDSLGDRLMYRLAYRNFSDHQTWLVSHSVTAGNSVGERWYEFHAPENSTTLSVYQQGTFAPDSNYRWMGSIAMDSNQDIGLGYSISSSTVFPSINFTGRTTSDTLGTMETEAQIVAGTGSQTDTSNRWGDYTSMAIDAADDCTFWYTNQYYMTTASFDWSTQLASFKFAGCGGQGGGPAVTLVPTSLKWGKILVGVKSGTKKVTLTNTGNATLNISGIVPSGDYALAPAPPKKACGSTVAAGKSCVFKVTFTPTQKGLRTGNVTITDNAPDSPQSVALSGTGK